MVEKKVWTLGEFRSATKEADDATPLRGNGVGVTEVLLQRRDDDGSLYVNVLAPANLVEAPPVAPPADSEVDQADSAATDSIERRQNDPLSLTEDERVELAELEELAGVAEQRDPLTGNEGDPL